jgi:hypothetical protein
MQTFQYNIYRIRSGQSLTGCLIILCLWLLIVWALSSWTDRNLDFWLTYFKGETIDCPFWLSTVVTFLAPVALFLNVIGEVARLCV